MIVSEIKEDSMKRVISLMLLSCTSTFAVEYIVKIRPGMKNNLNLSSFNQVRAFDLSYGSFVLLDSSNKSDIESLKSQAAVEYLEPNYIYSKFDLPTDSEFPKQWGLLNNGKNSRSWLLPGKKGVDINAIKAWKITKGSAEVKIAVIDTGVDYNHEDLKNNIMINEAELNGLKGVDDDNNGYVDDIYGYDFANDDADPMDGHGHGTHCAGVIGAEHNGIGIAGVNAHVKILPIKFLTNSGSGTLEGALKSIDYAVARGVQIMSNSWGGGERSEALFEAIQRAEAAGIIFIAAAGNSRSDNDAKPTYPANYKVENVLSVGALNGRGKRASFSNYGKKTVHVFAPGEKIYSTMPKNRYKKMSGTSMACPHVAGVAGLLLAYGPSLNYQELKKRLMSTSTLSRRIDKFTASGYVDAYHALINQAEE